MVGEVQTFLYQNSLKGEDVVVNIVNLSDNSIVLRIFIFLLVACFASGYSAPKDPLYLFMEDGQQFSRPVKVFVTADISANSNPELRLNNAPITFKPMVIAQNQKTIQRINNFEQEVTGTFMVFNLQGVSLSLLQPTMRVYPTLTWKAWVNDDAQTVRSAGPLSEVYLGNIFGALFWGIISLAVLLGVIVLGLNKKIFEIFLSTDGRISLWKMQITLWTLIIGTAVFCFSLVRFDIPEIPNSLVALMGISFLTGSLVYYLGTKRVRKARKSAESRKARKERGGQAANRESDNARNPEIGGGKRKTEWRPKGAVTTKTRWHKGSRSEISVAGQPAMCGLGPESKLARIWLRRSNAVSG